MEDATGTVLQDGLSALERHAWKEAYALLGAADRESPGLDGDGLMHLAEAAWWCGHLDDQIDAMERAYAAFLREGRRPRAAYAAMLTARGYGNKLESATASGWRSNAVRLLADEPDCVEQGHLKLRRGSMAMYAGEVTESLDLFREAADSGGRFGDRSLVAMAHHLEGQALLRLGNVDTGMALIDEATAEALGNELDANTSGLIFCWTIASYRDLADVQRAAQWTDAAGRWCSRESISGFPGICRIHRGEILRLRGAWAEAESEALAASVELLGYNPTMAGNALVELAEVQRRMGRLDEAQESINRARQLGGDIEPVASLLSMSRGELASARASLNRILDEPRLDRFDRARALTAATDVGFALNDAAMVGMAARELSEMARVYDTTLFRAEALKAEGAQAVLDADGERAASRLAASLRLWSELRAPFEAAQTRAMLSRALRVARDEPAARAELAAALAALEAMGASRESARLTALAQPGRTRDSTTVRRAFMFTDVVGSTALLEAIGDDAWTGLRDWHDRTLRGNFARHGGEEVDHAGDGFCVSFEDPAAAIDCAISIQVALVEHSREHGFAPQVRIGLHAADAQRSGREYAGRALHLAARIAAAAEGGQILASAAAVELAGRGDRAGPPVEMSLKGVKEAVQVTSIRWP
jgi:class 3 adenylate cyclase